MESNPLNLLHSRSNKIILLLKVTLLYPFFRSLFFFPDSSGAVLDDQSRPEKEKEFYLPEDGIYRAAQESFPRFRRQQFGSQDGHKLVEINLSVTWQTHIKTSSAAATASPFLTGEQPFMPVGIITVFLKLFAYFSKETGTRHQIKTLHAGICSFVLSHV